MNKSLNLLLALLLALVATACNSTGEVKVPDVSEKEFENKMMSATYAGILDNSSTEYHRVLKENSAKRLETNKKWANTIELMQGDVRFARYITKSDISKKVAELKALGFDDTQARKGAESWAINLAASGGAIIINK